MKLKEEFVKRSKKLLGNEAEKYFKMLEKPLTSALRVNTLKISPSKLKERLENSGFRLRPVPWCAEGFRVDSGPEKLGNTLEHFLGYYYLQEPASMIPPLLMELKEGQKILDMAASPGSKTGQIAGLINDEGLIIANDVRIDRVSILKYNLQRMGVRSVVITRRDGKSYKNLPEFFDRVLLDAPCSGEGVIRKNPYVAVQWNEHKLIRFAKEQKKLILSAYEALKPGGILVYSTCSLAPEENEEVINFLLEHTNAKVMPARLKGLKAREGVTEWRYKMHPSIKNCSRIYPQDNDTEGFFVAKIMKEEGK